MTATPDPSAAAAVDPVRIRLAATGPFAHPPLERFLTAHLIPGVERMDDGRLVRGVPASRGPAAISLALDASGADLEVASAHPDDVVGIVDRVRAWLDLAIDTGPIERALAADPELAPSIAARPGLRVPGSVDPIETAFAVVLGQQVSLAAARTFAGRLAAAHGDPAPLGLRVMPRAARVAGLDPAELATTLGVPGSRARTLVALAATLDEGAFDAADPAGSRARLLAVPGVGPWTSEYLALRVLRDRDALPAGDLVLRRELGGIPAREVERRAEAWRPYRGHALLHLWTRAVFA